ncbi:MAG: outer membrane protein assembly factor BamA [Micavibrio sp.]|nr:outer membrane protein assembly factor BamA [Micavibrio sp.]
MFRYVLISALAAILLAPSIAEAAPIRDIQIVGSERVEPETVKTYLPIQPGDELTDEALDSSLKALFNTGFFADVSVRSENNVVIVEVIENAVVNRIAFEGNDELDDEELRREITLRPRTVLTRTKVQNDLARLYQLYRSNGRFSANIDPKVIELDQNRVDLVFEITEGPVTEIRSIRFVGNENYDDSELRSVLSSKEDAWYRFLSNSDRYDPDRLAFDEEQLRRFYLSEGYADFRVLSSVAELSENKEDFYLTMTVDEGERYKVDGVFVHSSLQNFSGSVLKEEVTFEQGDWYNSEEVEASVDDMTQALEEYGYSFVKVAPDVKRDRENKTVDVIFAVTESQPVFVERIDIKGNLRTQDKVIRREFEVVEGDPLTKTQMAKSEQNVRNLNYFETVAVNTKPGSTPDRQVVEVDVTEKSTGELSVGAGFSTTDGPLGDFRIRERNFLGKGQEVVLAATVAGERTEFDASLTEPYFLDRDLSASVDAFHITRDLQDESSYDQRRTGGGFGFGYPLSENVRQNIAYRIETNEITDVQSDASRFIRDQEGDRLTSAVSQRLSYTDLDSIIFPNEGTRAWFDTELAGLGGDAKYISGRVGSQYFYPLTDNANISFLGEVGAITGIAGEDAQINERFYLGGNTLRGFESAGIGPRDITTNDALGGNYFYRGSVEGSFPIGLPEELGVKGHLFTDFGSLLEPGDETGPEIADSGSLRAAAGVGLSWRSPFGPIRFDLATPYLEEEEDETEIFRFSFGTTF